jgi:hypothetical protein
MINFKYQFWYILDDSSWLRCLKLMIYSTKKIYEKMKKKSKWITRMRKTRARKVVYAKQKSINAHFFEIFSNVCFAHDSKNWKQSRYFIIDFHLNELMISATTNLFSLLFYSMIKCTSICNFFLSCDDHNKC